VRAAGERPAREKLRRGGANQPAGLGRTLVRGVRHGRLAHGGHRTRAGHRRARPAGDAHPASGGLGHAERT